MELKAFKHFLLLYFHSIRHFLVINFKCNFLFDTVMDGVDFQRDEMDYFDLSSFINFVRNYEGRHDENKNKNKN